MVTLQELLGTESGNMRFYLATSFLFPRNFRLRLFFLCFFGAHLPIVSFLLWQLATGAWQWSPFLVLLGATLTGTLLALLGVGALLVPVERATRALAAVRAGERVEPLPVGGDDLLGRLLIGVNETAKSTDRRISLLDEAANRDALTGLRNRRGFMAHAGPMLQQHGRIAVALLDLDHFKQVNDRLGHAEGDLVLKQAASLMKTGVRHRDLLARWGGEEFVILFPDDSAEHAAHIMERLRRLFMQQPLVEINGVPLGFSCGIAEIGGGEERLERGLERADQALYEAKRHGRNRVCIAADA